jgi:hypothetical protein
LVAHFRKPEKIAIQTNPLIKKNKKPATPKRLNQSCVFSEIINASTKKVYFEIFSAKVGKKNELI